MIRIYYLVIVAIILVIAVIVAGFFFFSYDGLFISETVPAEENMIDVVSTVIEGVPDERSVSSEYEAVFEWQAPIGRAHERVMRKPFGILIEPKTSPIQPERFAGYHTGVDFEVFPEEIDVDVTVRAICSGPMLSARRASGYGGVVVQSCQYEDESVTVVYGHVRISSVSIGIGEELQAGDSIGVLGDAFSVETDGERKHLHLGIHIGPSADIRGYVNSRSQLSKWIDPCLVGTVCGIVR